MQKLRLCTPGMHMCEDKDASSALDSHAVTTRLTCSAAAQWVLARLLTRSSGSSGIVRGLVERLGITYVQDIGSTLWHAVAGCLALA
jgi:hypothetical protein